MTRPKHIHYPIHDDISVKLVIIFDGNKLADFPPVWDQIETLQVLRFYN